MLPHIGVAKVKDELRWAGDPHDLVVRTCVGRENSEELSDTLGRDERNRVIDDLRAY